MFQETNDRNIHRSALPLATEGTQEFIHNNNYEKITNNYERSATKETLATIGTQELVSRKKIHS